MHQSAMCAQLDQTFCPLTTQWSPSSTARVRALARSDPAPGFGEALTPDLLRGQDLREVALLLLVAAPGRDRRAGHAEADHADVPRRLGPRRLLEVDALERVRRALPAELLRPGQPDVAGVVQLAAPLAGERLVEPAGLGLSGGPAGREVRVQPATQLGAESSLGRGIAEVHDGAR